MENTAEKNSQENRTTQNILNERAYACIYILLKLNKEINELD